MTTPLRINILHVLLVAPLMIYVGTQAGRANPQVFSLMLLLGIVALFYHAYIISGSGSSSSFGSLAESSHLSSLDIIATSDSLPDSHGSKPSRQYRASSKAGYRPKKDS